MKKTTTLIALCLASLLCVGGLVSPTCAQRAGETRYERVTNSIFAQTAYNGDPSMLDGYGRKTAAELGLTGQKVYNEYPEGPRVVVLHPTAVLLYDTASFEIMYLDGCRRAGKAWYNRIKLVQTTVTVERRVEVPAEPVVRYEPLPGPKGDQGEPGPQGPQGPRGEKGEKGKDGGLGWKGWGAIAGVGGVAVWALLRKRNCNTCSTTTPPKTYVPPGPGAGSGNYKRRN